MKNLNSYKEWCRKQYDRGDRNQDHGCRGNSPFKKTRWLDECHYYWTYEDIKNFANRKIVLRGGSFE